MWEECLSALTTCTLQIEDINDNKPTFEHNSYVAYVKENVPVAEIFLFNETDAGDALDGTIKVSDLDKTPNFNQINVSFEDSSYYDSLTINPTMVLSSGFITIMSKVADNELLDFEKSPDKRVNITLTATDKANDTFSGHTSVIINIVDVNDNPPRFTETNYDVTIAEDLSNIQENNVLVSVDATDDDVSADYGTASVRYSLISPPVAGIAIDEVTGDIVIDPANNPLDAEQSGQVVLQVEARDCGGHGETHF